ncbi:MAG: PA14 domain-containing protein [Pirellulales bacterium]|nr:PA14 domain-containing protein [Pirellulales bacterium]
MSKRSKLSKIISLFAIAGMGATAATAADSVWIGGTSDFGSASNWSAGVPGAPDKATFNNTATGFSVDLTSGPFTINQLEFAGPATTGFTLSNGSLTTGSIQQLGSFSGDRANTISSQVTSFGPSAISSGVLSLTNTQLGASANNFAGASIAVNAGGTLRASGAGANVSNSVGGATINLAGGTFIADIASSLTIAGQLSHEYYNYDVGGRTAYGPRFSAGTSNGIIGFDTYEGLLALRDRMGDPETALASTEALDFPNGGGFTTLDDSGGNPFPSATTLNADEHVAGFFGNLNITTPGTYTFQTAGDDGSVIFIDGVKVVDNNSYQGINDPAGPTNQALRTGTINLSAGQHQIAIGFYEKGGGSGFVAGWNGPDTGNVLEVIDPVARSANFSAIVPEDSDDFTSNNISVSGGTASTILSVADTDVDYGALTINNSQLNTNGGKANFAGTTITGTATINNTTGASTGVLSKSGGVATLVKTGPGTLEITNTSSASNLTAGDTVQLNGGVTKVVKNSTVSTIGGAAVNLAGGTVVFENTAPIVGGSLQARFFDRGNFNEGGTQWPDTVEGMRFIETRLADVSRNATGAIDFTDGLGNCCNGDGKVSQFFYGADTGDFGVIYTGYFTTSVTTGTALAHEFATLDNDDSVSLWIDLNNNGTFDRIDGDNDGVFTTPGVDVDELIDNDRCCNQDDISSISLDAGTYKIALAVNDSGGGGSYHFQFGNTHEGGTTGTINPGATPAQFGQRGVMDLTNTPITVSGPGSAIRVEGAGANFGALTLQNTGVLTVDTAATSFSSISVDGNVGLNTVSVITPPLSGISATPGSVLSKGGGGVLDLSNTAMTPLSSNLTLKLDAGVTRATTNVAGTVNTLGGSTLQINGGRLELNISDAAVGNVSNALRARLYRSTTDVIDDASGAGINNLLATGVSVNNRNLVGTANFTDGAGNCCSGDVDVDGFHGINTGDTYTQVLSGKINISASELATDFNFGVFDGDDQMAVWVDLNQNNTYETGEMITSAGCCNNDVQATINGSAFTAGAGAYNIALVTRDTGGGGSQRFLFSTGTGTALETIQPNKPSQAGRFSTTEGFQSTLNFGTNVLVGAGTQRLFNGDLAAANLTGTFTLQDGARLVNNLPTTYSNIAVSTGVGTVIGEDPTVANETTVVNANIAAGTTLAFESPNNINEVNPTTYTITGTVAGSGTLRPSGDNSANATTVSLTNNGVMFSGAASANVQQGATLNFNPGTGNTGTGATMTGGTLQGNLNFSSGTTNLPSAVFNQPTAPTVENGVLLEALLLGGFDTTTPLTGSFRNERMRYGNEYGSGEGGTVTQAEFIAGFWRDNQLVGYKGQIFIPDNAADINLNPNSTNLTTSDGLGSVAFGENFDDDVYIRLGGVDRYRNTQWDDNGSTGEIILPVGWTDIEVRFHEGGGGAGPSNNSGWSNNPGGDLAPGFGIDLDGSDGFDDLSTNMDDPFQNGNNSGTQSQYVRPVHGFSQNGNQIQFRYVTDPANLGNVNVSNGATGNVNAITNMWNVNLSGAGTLGTTGASNSRAINATGTGGTLNNAGAYNTAVVSVADGSSFTKSGAGTLSIGAQSLGNGTFTGNYSLGNNATASFNGGTTNITINAADARSIGTGTTVNVGGTLNVAGSQTVLSAGANKSKVVMTSSGVLNVNHNDTAGRVVGTGAGFGTAAGTVNVAAQQTFNVDGLRVNKLSLAAGNATNFTRVNVATNDGGSAGLVVINNTAADAAGLVMGNESYLDLNDNDLVLYHNDSVNSPNPIAAVTALVDNYYSFGSAPGNGVPMIGSTAVDNSSGTRVIIPVDNLNSQFGDVGNPFYDLTLGDSGMGTGFNQVIVRFTYPGDYNLDGKVDGSDYVVVDSNQGATSAGLTSGWTLGDGDFDGVVTSADYLPIDSFFGSGVGNPLSNPVVTAIPEPSTWVLGSLAAIGLGVMGLRRRQK